MRIRHILSLILFLMPWYAVFAQNLEGVIDYDNPHKYILAGARIEGNTYFGQQQLLQQVGLQKGMELTVPGEDITAIINRLWFNRYFRRG